jgi:hypothetical protein
MFGGSLVAGKENHMTLTLLDQTSAINLTAVRTINFDRHDEGITTATVHFLGDGTEPIRYKGDAAKTLLSLVRGQPTVRHAGEFPIVAHASATKETEQGTTAGVLVSIQPRMLNKAWYYLKREDGREFFLAFVNKADRRTDRTSSSMRMFHKDTGKAYGQTDYPLTKLPFQEAYAAQIAKCQGPLRVPYQPNLLDAMDDGLPQDVLSDLSSQIKT